MVFLIFQLDFINVLWGPAWQILGSLASFALLLCPLVFFHELGHLWVARFFGVAIESFSIGFGKEIWGWTDKKGTRWKLCPIPLGGYIRMVGEEKFFQDHPDVSPPRQAILKQQETLDKKGPLARMAIAFAGPLASYVLAFLLFCGFFYMRPSSYLLVKEVAPIPGSLASGLVEKQEIGAVGAPKVGLRAGDRIHIVNGEPVRSAQGLKKSIQASFQKKHRLDVLVVRDRAMVSFAIQKGHYHGDLPLGFSFSEEKSGFFMFRALEAVYSVSKETVEGLWGAVKRSDASQLAGPVQLAHSAKGVLGKGLLEFVSLMGMFSTSLGLLNLFPLPVLDGGHILMCGIEYVRKKPLSEKTQNYIYLISGALLFALMIFLVFKDVWRIFF